MVSPNARITRALAAGRSFTTGPWNVVRLKTLFAPMAIILAIILLIMQRVKPAK